MVNSGGKRGFSAATLEGTMTRIQDHKRIHLIGIGGCSMNGLALILKARGYEVQGSDMTSSPFTERLAELGVPVTLGHAAENLGDADLVIYSAAIKPENPERRAARERGVSELERSEALGQISAQYKTVVGVAGCHGKTTITSMLALIAEQDALDATVHVGGFVDFLQGGTRIGSHDLFITEACEYVESFLTLHPSIAVINNIDDDHLDYFRDIDHITDAFRKYLALLPEDGLFLGCTDDFRVRGLMAEFKGHSLSYGMKDADYIPSDVQYDEKGNPSFTLLFRGNALGRIKMGVPGEHNMINAVAAAAAALALGAPFELVARALGDYRLTRRRFEYYGESRGVSYIHDFAHHPGEIRAVMQAASRYPHKKLYVVFQCNSYTRAKTLFTGDMSCMNGADEVLVPDIFPGREQDTGIVHAKDIVNAIERSGVKAVYLPTFEEIREYLIANAQPGDAVITLGSGDVYKKTWLLME